MSKFDTHGGYFAPKDYMKVNEGGSHEENPYGGVQVGVDQQGTPNLLEEGEPVYKDYVYSDNIVAEREFLEQNHLSPRYAGKLYSDIADDILTEAEERPLDPTSRNGLEAMLGRLAEAQEAQKQRDQQAQMEEELANLSPEELDQLEMMLSQQEQPGMEEQVPEEAMMQQQMAAQQMGAAMPMMGLGGTLLRRYDLGGTMGEDEDIEKMLEAARSQREGAAARRDAYKAAEAELRKAERDVKWRNFVNNFWYMGDRGYDREKAALDRMLEDYASGQEHPMQGAINQEDAIRRQSRYVDELRLKKEAREAKLAELEAIRSAKAQKLNSLVSSPYLGGQSYQTDSTIVAPPDSVGAISPIDTTATLWDWGASDVDLGQFKFGGFLGNKYPDGGWMDFLKRVREYQASSNASRASGKYAIDTDAKFWNGQTGRDVEGGEFYDPFTKYVLSHAEGDNVDENVLEYLRLLDKGINTSTGARTLFDPATGKLVNGWQSIYTGRRGDGDLGIYHLNPDADFWTAAAQAAPDVASSVAQTQDKSDSSANDGSQTPDFGAFAPYIPGLPYGILPGIYESIQNGSYGDEVLNASVVSAVKPAKVLTPEQKAIYAASEPRDYYTYPTTPRYAGAIGAGLLGLYDIFQQPDHYALSRLSPYLPEGRIHMQNQVYNPVDQNMVANAIAAQGNATNRTLRNSGLGSGAAAAILASDNNYTGNLGSGFLQTWDANNQRRNAVIAANNQAEAQRAQFDYTVDAARKRALNQTAVQNAQNDLMLQRLNYGAEGEKYAAISNQIGNALSALSDIGRENFSANQVNNNPNLMGYRIGPRGETIYYPWMYGPTMAMGNLSSCGGFLKKLKK